VDSNMVCKKFEDRWKELVQTIWVRVFITKDGVYTKMNRRGERVKRYGGAVK
jgi:hypothetical protein